MNCLRLVEDAIYLSEKGRYPRIERALYLIYHIIEEMFQENRFGEVNNMLISTPIVDCNDDILIGLLTATLPAKTKLTHRPTFFNDVEKMIRERGTYEDDLLKGLE